MAKETSKSLWKKANDKDFECYCKVLEKFENPSIIMMKPGSSLRFVMVQMEENDGAFSSIKAIYESATVIELMAGAVRGKATYGVQLRRYYNEENMLGQSMITLLYPQNKGDRIYSLPVTMVSNIEVVESDTEYSVKVTTVPIKNRQEILTFRIPK